MSVFRTSIVMLALLGAAACASDRITDVAAPSTLGVSNTMRLAAAPRSPQFLRPATGAPTIANPVVQFWAKRGVETTAAMYYHAAPGARDSVTFFSLRLRAKSLWQRPDGTAFANGDSILITLTLVDAQRGIVDCQPAGLRFDPGKPVRLKISFAETDGDVNDDGRVDGVDAAITRTFAIWRKEAPADPWQRLLSNVSVGAHEVEAEIGGFTGYAIAW